MAYYNVYASPIGKILIVSDGSSVTKLTFIDDSESLSGMEKATGKEINLAVLWLNEYFSGKIPSFSVPIRLEGTAFQKKVWTILRTIDYGNTITYGEIASSIAKEMGKERMSAQAVGQAVGKNPVSIIVPCHRVIGKNGNLTGYAGGLGKKDYLLQLERQKNQNAFR